MRNSMKLGLLFVVATLVATGCQGDRIANPDAAAPGPGHAGLDAIAVRLRVDVTNGTVRVLPPSGAPESSGGPSLAILGSNEVGVSTSNLVRSAPVNGKVTVTFDAALTNRLTSSSLIPSTFPGSTTTTGLLLFPFRVTAVTGGTAGQVVPSTDWDGDGTAGSGAPRNFFNDFGCPAGTNSDCYRWEQYAAPLGPGETSAARQVGFTMPKAVTAFTVSLVLAADIGNDLPAVAAIGVTPPSYVMSDGFPAGFSAVAYDALNNPLPWATLTWTTADITALEFQNGGALVGVITGPSQVVHGRKVGQTSFTVSSGGVSVVVPVDIQVNTVALVQLYTPDSSIVVGDQIQGDVRIKDHSGGIIPGFQATWSTTDPSVITVDQNGLISAVGPGIADVVATAALQSGRVTITVAAAPLGALGGTVYLNEAFLPRLAGARVDAVLGGLTFTTYTDGLGQYAFPSIPVGHYQVTVQKTNCRGWTSPYDVAESQTTTADFVLDCPAVVSGRVIEVFGNPLPGGISVSFDTFLYYKFVSVQSDGSYTTTLDPSPCGFGCSGIVNVNLILPSTCQLVSGPWDIGVVHGDATYTVPDFLIDCAEL